MLTIGKVFVGQCSALISYLSGSCIYHDTVQLQIRLNVKSPRVNTATFNVCSRGKLNGIKLKLRFHYSRLWRPSVFFGEAVHTS